MYLDFRDVLGVQLKYTYNQLIVSVADDAAAMDLFVNVPERHSHRYMRLAVGDEISTGFVVCGRLDVRTDVPVP